MSKINRKPIQASPTITPEQTAINLFAVRVYREALRLLKKNRSQDADDIAEAVALKFLVDPIKFMERFLTPEDFARSVRKYTAKDWRRTAMIQRGEGARGGRTAVVLDAKTQAQFDAEYGPRLGAGTEEIAFGNLMVDEILSLIPNDDDRELARRHFVDGDQIVEIAHDMKVHHSTVSRKIAKLREILREGLLKRDYLQMA